MRHMMLTLLLIGTVGVFAIAEGYDSRTDVAGAEGMLRKVSTLELVPGAVDVRESHRGAEVIYVLAGAGTLETDGKPSVVLQAGTVVQLFPKHHHVLTNTSLTQSLKVLVVDLLNAGQPRLILANRASRQQKEARQQNEGCQLMPNGDLDQHKGKEQETSIMKGLVF